MPALAILFVLMGSAFADSVTVGPNDVETVFFINKSDDRNRVDYGIRLDSDCRPSPKDDALFYYWREFENSPPVRTHGTNFMDRIAYGISSQKITDGGDALVRLKQIDRDITIHAARGADHRCTAVAATTIGGVPGARLDSVYVKLGGVFSVEYVEVHGAHPTTRAALVERISR